MSAMAPIMNDALSSRKKAVLIQPGNGTSRQTRSSRGLIRKGIRSAATIDPMSFAAWPGAPLRRPEAQLFLTSLLGLYAELLCIRWMPAHVRFLSYFTNFILLASFLGLGVGILSARRKLPLGPKTFPLLLLFAAILIAATRFELHIGSAGVLYYGSSEGAAPSENGLALPAAF